MTAPAHPIPALPAPTSVDAVIDRLILVAGSQEGYHEGRSRNEWNNDTAFGVWFPMNYQPWCAIFVSWSADRATIPESVIPKHSYTPTGYNWFKSRGRAVSKPKRGDIMYVYSASQKRIYHVGIVESVSGNKVRTIEGNTNDSGSAQGDGVYRLTRTIDSHLKFVRPNYAAAVQVDTNPGTLISLKALAYAANGGYFHIGQRPAEDDARAIARWMNSQAIISDRDLRVWEAFIRTAKATDRPADWQRAGAQYAGLIRRYQARFGLREDGVVGPKTKAHMTAMLPRYRNFRLVA